MPSVSIHNTEKVFDVKENEVIYDALSDRGENLPHGCLSGSCGACRIEIVSGSENLQAAGIIESNTVDSLKDEFKNLHGDSFIEGKTFRLSCRAKIMSGEVVIKPV